MEFSFAPLEGITLFSFRNTHHRFFPGIDKYYTPFLVANQTKKFKNKEKRELAPENNAGIYVVPQILTNKTDELLWALQTVAAYGYQEINFNLGCPSPTVVTRGKGSGMLIDPEELDEFLEAVFEGMQQIPELSNTRLTVKTRIGFWDPAEGEELLRVYNRYPIAELIVHPRVQKDGYSNHPNLDMFEWMLQNSVHPVCYNGDLVTPEDYEALIHRFPNLSKVMIGRGLVRNPALVQQILGGEAVTPQVLWDYQRALFDSYKDSIQRESDIVHKMKELWTFMHREFPDSEKVMKNIRKAKTRSQYEEAIRPLFQNI